MKRLGIAAGVLVLLLALSTAVKATPGLRALHNAVLRLLVAEAPQDGQGPQAPTDATPAVAVGGPTNLGQMSVGGVAHASATDVLLPGTWSAFAFSRRYTSNGREERNQDFDFGDQILFTVPSAPGAPFGPRNWTHNLYAYAQYTSFAQAWQVRAGGGAVLVYGGLNNLGWSGPWLRMSSFSSGDARFDGTKLLIPGDGVYYFEQRINLSGGYILLLKRIEDSERNADGTPRYRAILDYTPPPSAECAGYTLGTNPYVTKVTNGEGFVLKLHYKTLPTSGACVLDWVSVTPPGTGTTESKRVSYGYLDATSPTKVKLNGVSYFQPDGADGGTQAYSYNRTAGVSWDFVETTNGIESRRLNMLQGDGGMYDGYVRTQSFGAPVNVVWTVPDGGVPAFSYSLPVIDVFSPPGGTSVQEESVPRGDGTSSTVTVRRALEYHGLQGYVTRGQGDFCVAGSCSGVPAPGQREWGWGDGGVYGYVPTAYRDAIGNLTLYTWNAPDAGIQTLYSQQGQQAPMALTSVTHAFDLSGTPALLKTNYEYAYSTSPVPVDGGTAQTLHRTVKRVFQPSVLKADEQASTLYVRDSQSNRVKAVIRSGWTQDVSGNVLANKTYVGTFYFTKHECGAPPTGPHSTQAGTTVDDPLGRVVEIHGPCFVDSEAATDCRTGASDVNMSLTQITYWPQNDSNPFRRNRVAQVATSARNSGRGQCGSAAANNLLVTEILAYDERGHATDVFAPSGVETKAVYKGDLLDTTQTITPLAILTSTRGYDAGRLTWLRHPSGVYDVYCYRIGTSSGACTGGTLSDKLQWRATATNPTASAWTERVIYSYIHGRLTSEDFWENSGVVTRRRTIQHQSDPFGRPTWEGAGDFGVPLTVYGTAGFDGNNNRVGLGQSINNPQALCPSGSGSNCSVIGFDALNRFISLKELGAGPDVFFATYDWEQGYPRAIGLSDNVANKGRAGYAYDDFGNVVRIDATWMTNNGPTGSATYTYDAAGRLITKVSATMKGSGACLFHSYDALGRELSYEYRTNCSQAAPQKLYAFAYDKSASPPSGCAGNANAPAANSMGRLQMRVDSFGQTWFAYDTAGNLVAEQRSRSGDTQCQPLPASFTSFPTPGFPGCMPLNLSSTTNGNKRLNTLYQYDSIGRLTAIQYPHGRIIRYGYGSGANQEKIASVSADLLRGSVCGAQVLVDGIQWEPFGGLRAYHAVAPFAVAPNNSPDFTIEYLLGSPDGASNPVPQICNQSRPATLDFTGRLRSLWVSTGNSIGSGTGTVFKQSYAWNGVHLGQQSTCLLASAGAARVESYGYDTRLRLTAASRPTKQKDTGGALGKRGYTYDGLGNRLTEQSDCWAFTAGYGGSPAQPDWLTSYSSTTPNPPSSCSAAAALAACQGSAYVSTSFGYDANGRVTQKRVPASASLAQQWAVTFDYTTESSQAAEGGVYKSASLNGGPPYQYFYDAAGRRRFKSYPSVAGMGDEFFYVGGNMVEDVGISSVSGVPPPDPASPPIDEYVWLGGRPVVVLKGKFAAWARQSDDVGTVTRNDRTVNAGPHQLVTDYLGKPVLLLDPWGRVAGAADYDPFGNVNKATLIGETAHPYGISAGKILAQLAQPPTPTGSGASLLLDLRVRFALVDSAGSGDYAVLTTPDVNERFAIDGTSTKVFGAISGRPFSKWVRAPSDGKLQVRYYSGAGSSTFKGFVVEGYEYRRYQSSVTPVAVTPTWVPFRLPGQYFDEETELFQNNARFYDPQVGRFLQPDSAWNSPSILIASGAAGRATPVYAYAFNEPLTTADPTGNVALDCNGFANCGTAMGSGPGLSNGMPGTQFGWGEHSEREGNLPDGRSYSEHTYTDPSIRIRETTVSLSGITPGNAGMTAQAGNYFRDDQKPDVLRPATYPDGYDFMFSKRYETPEMAFAAALVALIHALNFDPTGRGWHVEYAGLIYQNSDGTYGITRSATLDLRYRSDAMAMKHEVPDGATIVASYHNHPAYFPQWTDPTPQPSGLDFNWSSGLVLSGWEQKIYYWPCSGACGR